MKRFLIALLASAAPVLAFADYNDHIAGQEGGDSYSIVNSGGSSAVGKYQITAGTWASLGYFQYNGSGSKGDWSNYSATDAAKAAGVNSLSDLRFTTAGASLQDRANGQLAAQNWASMSNSTRGLVGQTINGVTITETGLLSASHFLGAGALNDWVASGFDPSVLPAEYLTANGYTSYAQLQDYIMKRLASASGEQYAGIGGGGAGAGTGAGMYDQTSNFPGLGTKRPVLIREVPPFQGERTTL